MSGARGVKPNNSKCYTEPLFVLLLFQNVLKAWSELGAKDPEKLKALLVERRLKTFQGLLLQTVLDVVACGGERGLIQQLHYLRRACWFPWRAC